MPVVEYGARSRALLSQQHLTLSSFNPSVCSCAKNDKVIVISGPTGSGKSRLACQLARRLNGEIISADSVQIYRGLNVGSAKPSLEERKQIPHHLIDLLSPCEDYSCGQFFEDARKATHEVLQKGRVPIVTGGTGLYLRWFIYGKPNVPKASQDVSSEIFTKLEDYRKNGDWDAAVSLLVEAGDPKASFIPQNNWYRLRRSLEIIKASGSPPSDFQLPYDAFKEQIDGGTSEASSTDEFERITSAKLDFNFSCFFLASGREELYRRIDHRCEEMLTGSENLLTEATMLLDLGLLPNSNSATRAIGYRHAMEFLLRCREHNGRSTPDQFLAFLDGFQKASRNFAKRQFTWFRNERIYTWLDATQPLDHLNEFIYAAYCDDNGRLGTPDSLKRPNTLSTRREALALKSYRPLNRYFKTDDDCGGVLHWIQNCAL